MTAAATNFPPPDADPLRERLAESYAGLIKRANELTAAAGRVPQALDEESLRTATDFVAKQLKPHKVTLDRARVAEKEPFLSGGRTVDAFFRDLLDPLTVAITSVERAINAYLRQKAAEERRRREEEAARQRAEAEAAAAAMASEDDLDAALAADQAAAEAARLAQAKPADLARTHGAHGGVATLRASVGFEIVDRPAACAGFWSWFDDEAIAKAARAFIRHGGESLKGDLADGPVVAHGVRFFIEEKALVR